VSDIANIMKLDVVNLKERQKLTLKKHCLKVLKLVSNCIENDRFDELESMLFSSPAGDGYGCDNMCIQFGWDDLDYDISEIVDKLKELQSD